ncbi:MAG: hypothetical protein IJ646_07910 [Clostridia bacterium]|nr:hypothetical protein [Clostridia bacterium]
MKIMSREFTLAERILIAVLALILVGLVYYRFVDQTVRETIANNEAESAMLQTELDAMQQRLAYLSGIQGEMDKLEADGRMSWMGSYNNSKEEVAFLNDILADTVRYSVSFADVSRIGDQIRRSFTLQYTAATYAAAQDIMLRLATSKNRCLVGDVRCNINSDGTVSIAASATFYETMVGGTPDAALPASSAAANS